MKPTILVVDDDRTFLNAASLALSHLGRVVSAMTCEESFQVLAKEPVHVVVSDYFLGQGDGHDVVREASRSQNSPPVILVTGHADKDMAVKSANLHVFALLEKPVDATLLVGTVERALRSGQRASSKGDRLVTFRSGKGVTLVMDAVERKVRWGEAAHAELTETEFRILSFLLERAGTRVSREQIVDAVWGGARLSRNVFDTHLSNLRKKVPTLSILLKSIRGGGYVFE